MPDQEDTSGLRELRSRIEQSYALLASGDTLTAISALQQARDLARQLAPAAPVAVAA